MNMIYFLETLIKDAGSLSRKKYSVSEIFFINEGDENRRLNMNDQMVPTVCGSVRPEMVPCQNDRHSAALNTEV
jgi:hypothetical protein